jgi:hypothetical protein
VNQRPSNWLRLFREFIADIRIASKEIYTEDPRGAPLELWESQRRFVDEVGNGLDNGIHIFNTLKGRQLGITTVSLAIDLFWLAMHDNIIGCLVTDTEKNRDVNRALLEKYIGSFGSDYFGGRFALSASNRTMLKFTNGARLDFLVAGVKKKGIAWGEGVGYTLIHGTEIAKYGEPEGFKSLQEGFAQTNPHRLMICESTAMGFNHWQARWQEGLNKIYTERSFFLGWWSNPLNQIGRADPRFKKFGRAPASGDERTLIQEVSVLYDFKVSQEQLAWIRWKESDAGAEQDLNAQNNPWTPSQAFVQTGRSFFQMKLISDDIKNIINENLKGADKSPFNYEGYRYEVDGDFFSFRMDKLDFSPDNIELVELKIWEEPIQGAKYVIGFDPAYGRTEHKDTHALSVWRCFADKLIQVAEYCTADVELKYASWVLFHLCAAYGDVIANVELTGPGREVMIEFKHLRELLGAQMNRSIVQEREWQDAAANARWFLYHKADSPGPGYVANFESNWRTKQELMHGFRGAYTAREVEIKSLKLLNEMKVVVIVDDRIGAPDSSNPDIKDDRVFSSALAVRAWREWIRPGMISDGLTYEVVMREASGESTNQPRIINNMVMRFLAQKQEEAENYVEPRGPKWHVDNGIC